MKNSRSNRTATPLRRGDSIGIFAPAGPLVDREGAEAGLRILKEAGFNPRYQRGIFQRRSDYLAGSDEQRIAELHELLSDPETGALMAMRGGYGSLRLLNLIDWQLLKARPKIIVGFSDLTVLHAACLSQTAMVNLHGPMLCTLDQCDRESILHLFNTLTGSPPTSIRPAGLEIIRPGSARGPLIGGNLTCLSHLLATPWEPGWQGGVLLLEEVGEAPYRVDRLLTQLAMSGRLEQVTAIIVGELTDCGSQESCLQRLLELTQARKTPIWANFPAGHGRRNLTLPLGAEVELDSNRGELRIINHPLGSSH